MSGRQRVIHLINTRRNFPKLIIDFIDITGNQNYLYRSGNSHSQSTDDFLVKELQGYTYMEIKININKLRELCIKKIKIIKKN